MVFGISGICPVIYVEDEGFEKLAEEIIDSGKAIETLDAMIEVSNS